MSATPDEVAGAVLEMLCTLHAVGEAREAPTIADPQAQAEVRGEAALE